MFKNKQWVTVRVWKHQTDESGCKLYDDDGHALRGKLVASRTLHNSVGTEMLNAERDYIAYATNCAPFNRVCVYWDDSNEYEYVDATCSDVEGKVATLASAEWHNSTGTAQTVNRLELVNLSLTVTSVYGTVDINQTVQNDEVMTIEWTHEWTFVAPSPGGVTNTAFKEYMRNYFDGSTTISDPVYSFRIEDTIVPYYRIVTGSSTSMPSDGVVQMTFQATNADAVDHLVTKITGYFKEAETAALYQTHSVEVTLTGSDDKVNAAGHGFSDGDKLAFLVGPGAALPTGVDDYKSAVYYVVNAATDSFQIAETQGGDPVTWDGDSSGTITAYFVFSRWESGTTATLVFTNTSEETT